MADWAGAKCLELETVRNYAWSLDTSLNYDVLLTVHLSIFILIINQLDVQNLFLQ